MTLHIQDARNIIHKVMNILNDSSTVTTPLGIPPSWNVIIEMSEQEYHTSYVIALYTPDGLYPLTNERLIHRCTEQVGTNLYTSEGIHWVVDRWQCFHNPSTTQHPHTFVDGVHVIQLPNFDNESYEDDNDGSSWGEGSVVSEGDLSEAGTAPFVRDEGGEGYDFF
jgi:hypothetical protein